MSLIWHDGRSTLPQTSATETIEPVWANGLSGNIGVVVEVVAADESLFPPRRINTLLRM